MSEENTKNFNLNFFKSDLFKVTMKIAITVFIAVSLLLNLFNFVFPVVKYYGTSMEPTLEEGQILIIDKLSKVERGDIIAFYYNDKVLVRRIIAEGNHQVNVDIFGNVEVDGQKLDETYVSNKTLGQCNLDFPYSVPTAAYFVMGDNRETSMDSRLKEIGPVAEDRIIGKVVFSIYPFGTVS